jgi:hypothetical protein
MKQAPVIITQTDNNTRREKEDKDRRHEHHPLLLRPLLYLAGTAREVEVHAVS